MKESQNRQSEEHFVYETEQLFQRYYNATQEFRDKCRQNELFWRSEHWKGKTQKPGEPYPSVPALFSAVENVHAEVMDNYPEAVLLPCEADDEQAAQVLNTIVNTTLERREFQKKYRREMLRLLKNGACCFSVEWNSNLYGGYGDIDVEPWDIRYLLWDPDYDDIQNGKNLFRFSFCDREVLQEQYPDKAEALQEENWSGNLLRVDERFPWGGEENDILVIERWYKRRNPLTGNTAVHMAKVAGGVLLECSENGAQQQCGVYSDGKYPFVVFSLYELEDTPVGMGLIDVFKGEQEYIDLLERAILKNALISGKIRLLKDQRCNIPKEKLANWEEDVLEGSDVSERSLRWFQPASISPSVQEHLEYKINMLKRDSGQNDFARGEAGYGVTSASAIIALQNAANKRTRNIIGRIYDKFGEIVRMMIARTAQFYDKTRAVRVAGEKAVYFDPEDFARRSWFDFDVNVKSLKKNPTEMLYDNDFARQLFEAGAIDAYTMVEMMNFDGKETVLRKMREQSHVDVSHKK